MYSKADQALMEKYRDYYGEGWCLVDCRAMTWPFYGVNVSYKYSHEEPLPLVEEYVLKAVQTGCIQTVGSLGQFLGLEPTIVDSVLADLHQKEIVELTPCLSLTPKGQLLLDKQTRRVLKEETKRIYIDGVSGECAFADVKNSQNRGATVKPAIVYPRMETLEQHYRSLYESIEKKLGSPQKKNEQSDSGKKNTLKLEEIVGFQGTTHRLYVDRLVLFYKGDSSDDGRFLVLTDGEEDEEATRNLEEKFQEGKSGFDITDQPKPEAITSHRRDAIDSVTSRVMVTANTSQRITSLNDVKQCPEATVIEMLDHPVLLKLALKTTRSLLIINSPWVKDDVVDQEFQKDLEGALKRGVKVLILYGMQTSRSKRNKKSDISPNAEAFFKRLQGNKDYACELVKEEGNHAKVLICDCCFMVVSSYNWLSFPGGKTLDIRVETGTLIKNKSEIERKSKAFISKVKNK